jgi:hypothetical protein
VRRGDGGEMLVEKRQVQPLREDLGQIIQEMK